MKTFIFHLDQATYESFKVLAYRQASLIQSRLLELRAAGLLTDGFLLDFVNDVLEQKQGGLTLDAALDAAEQRISQLRLN